MSRSIPRSASEPLLRRVARGDRAAAVACVERYGAGVRALVCRLGVADGEADAAVRAIFGSLWQETGRDRPTPSDEAAFVVQRARRFALDHRAARGPQADAPGDESRSRPHQSSLFSEGNRVVRALAALDPDERAALELCVPRGLPYPRVASLTGLPTARVRDAARRGLVRVRELLHSDAGARSGAQP